MIAASGDTASTAVGRQSCNIRLCIATKLSSSRSCSTAEATRRRPKLFQSVGHRLKQFYGSAREHTRSVIPPARLVCICGGPFPSAGYFTAQTATAWRLDNTHLCTGLQYNGRTTPHGFHRFRCLLQTPASEPACETVTPRTATRHSASSLGTISGGQTGWCAIHLRRQAWEGLVASALAGRGQELVGVDRAPVAFP